MTFLMAHYRKVTPAHIDKIGDNEIVVFGSNLRGHHGAGLAATAMVKWGAKYGVANGPTGQCYALPTKPEDLRQSLPLEQIGKYVKQFIGFAENHPRLHFLVTEIGCGFAWYRPTDIAPLFKNALKVSNISLPASFIKVLEGKKR